MPADLVVHHSRGGRTTLLTEEVVAGARGAAGSLAVEALDAFAAGKRHTAAVASVEQIVAGLKWRRVLPVLEVVGTIGPAELIAARELGAAMAS